MNKKEKIKIAKWLGYKIEKTGLGEMIFFYRPDKSGLPDHIAKRLDTWEPETDKSLWKDILHKLKK